MADNKNEKSAPYNYVDNKHIPQGILIIPNAGLVESQRKFEKLRNQFFKENRDWYLVYLMDQLHSLDDRCLAFNGINAYETKEPVEGQVNEIFRICTHNPDEKQAEKDIRRIINSTNAREDEIRLDDFQKNHPLDDEMTYRPVVKFLAQHMDDIFSVMAPNDMLLFDKSIDHATFPIIRRKCKSGCDINSDYRIITPSKDITELIIELFNEYGIDDESISKYDKKLPTPIATTRMKLRSSVVKIAPIKEPKYVPDLTDKYAIARQIVKLTVEDKDKWNDRIDKVISLVNNQLDHLDLDTGRPNNWNTARKKAHHNEEQKLCNSNNRITPDNFKEACSLMAKLRDIIPIEQRDFKASPPRIHIDRKVISEEDKEYLFKLSQGICYCCGTNVSREHGKLGHIISHHFGGTETRDNIRYVCNTCNTNMGTADMYEYIIHNKLNSQHLKHDKTAIDRVKYITLGIYIIEMAMNRDITDKDRKYLSEYKKHTIEKRIERAQELLE